MLLAFYSVDNSQGYDRHSFDDIYDKPDEIKNRLAKLNDDEIRVYDMENHYDVRDLVEDYNDELLDGGWWVINLIDKEEQK